MDMFWLLGGNVDGLSGALRVDVSLGVLEWSTASTKKGEERLGCERKFLRNLFQISRRFYVWHPSFGMRVFFLPFLFYHASTSISKFWAPGNFELFVLAQNSPNSSLICPLVVGMSLTLIKRQMDNFL
jgi:hypothetical protein